MSVDMLLRQRPPKAVFFPQSRAPPSWFWTNPNEELQTRGLTADTVKEIIENINTISEIEFLREFNTIYRWLLYLSPIGILVGVILVFALWERREFYVSIVICFPSAIAFGVGFAMLLREYHHATDAAIRKVREHVEGEEAGDLNTEAKNSSIRWSFETEKVEGARGYEFEWYHIGITIDRTQIAPAVVNVEPLEVPPDNGHTKLHPLPHQSPTAGAVSHERQNHTPQGSPMAMSVSHGSTLL